MFLHELHRSLGVDRRFENERFNSPWSVLKPIHWPMRRPWRSNQGILQGLQSANPTFAFSEFREFDWIEIRFPVFLSAVFLQTGVQVDQPSSISEVRSTKPRLTIIIVNHESWPETTSLVETLMSSRSFRDESSEIVVVDNASRSSVPNSVAEPRRPNLQILLCSENGGFAAGVNHGWRKSRGDWLLVLNPDIIATPRFPDDLLDRIESYEKREGTARPGIFGFALLNPDGTSQPSVGVFPSLPRCLREQFIPRSRRKYQPVWLTKPGPVDWVTGACFLVAAELMNHLGGMDDEFFLYHEEVALCLTASRNGWTVEYDPSISVVHSHPLQNRKISPRMHVILRHSKLLYFRKYLSAWQFRILARGVQIEAGVRSLWSRALGRRQEATAWTTVGGLVKRLRIDPATAPRGVEVRRLADRVELNDGGGNAQGTPWRYRFTRTRSKSDLSARWVGSGKEKGS